MKLFTAAPLLLRNTRKTDSLRRPWLACSTPTWSRAFAAFALLAVCGSAAAQSQPTRIAVIHIQNALIATKEGQKAAANLTAKFEPKKKTLEAKQAEIANLQSELSKGSNTMAEAKRLSLTREIDAKNKSLQRDYQDFNDELEQEQGRLLNDLGQRIMVVIDKHARDNNFAVVVDISSQQTPVLWAANSIDITKEIVDLYDKNAPPAVSGPPAVAVKPMPVTPPVKRPVGAPK
jgi:outer membrane protein